MSSYNILSAIKVNAAALADAGYVDEAMPFINTLKSLFPQFERALEKEETAPTDGTVEAAKETIPPVLSDNDDDLSSFRVGQKVHTLDGDGILVGIGHELKYPYFVEFVNGTPSYGCYKESDITPF
jgi:hypothetical protein